MTSGHALLAFFDYFLLEILCILLASGKCHFNNFRNVLSTFISAIKEKIGSNHINLHFRCLLPVLSLLFGFGV